MSDAHRGGREPALAAEGLGPTLYSKGCTEAGAENKLREYGRVRAGPACEEEYRLAPWAVDRYGFGMRRRSFVVPIVRRVTTLAAVVMLVGCGRKTTPSSSGSPATGNGAGLENAAALGAPAASAATVTNAVTNSAEKSERMLPSPTPPTSFEGAKDVQLANDAATGCSAVHKDGWLRVACSPENPSGGKLLQISVFEDGGTNAGVRDVAVSQTEGASLVLPWQRNKRGLARLTWSDAVFEVETLPSGGGFRRVLPPAQAEACAKLKTAYDERMRALRKAETGPVRAVDVRKFPKLGECEAVGDHAWALEIKDVRAVGESVEREVALTLNVVHVAVDGAVSKAPWGPLTFAPTGLALPEFTLYDYDDDKSPELITRHDILKRGTRASQKPLSKLPSVFTYKNKRVVPYMPAGTLTTGGVAAENLESDPRPDIGDFGPFIAWLGVDCGVGKCPERIVGPRFYQRSLIDGAFDGAAPEVAAALQTACTRSRGALVGDVTDVGGKTRAALNVACARVRGESADAITATLNQDKTRICGDSPDCQLLNVLRAWAKAEPPLKLVLPNKE